MKEKPLYTVDVPFTVEFYDVDSMNVVWHGNYVKYMEKARCVLLDKLGFGYKEMVKHGYAFPVTTINLKYVRSLRFGEKAVVRTCLMEYENKIRILYEILDENGKIATKAESNQMALKLDTWESEFETPKVFIDKIEKILSEENK